jgi:Protein of unknown function (DUF2795)
MTDLADRLRFVLDGTSFPVDRCELIARAEHYSADATTLRELHGLEPRGYAGLTDIIDAIDRFHRKPTERYASSTAQLKGDLR